MIFWYQQLFLKKGNEVNLIFAAKMKINKFVLIKKYSATPKSKIYFSFLAVKLDYKVKNKTV